MKYLLKKKKFIGIVVIIFLILGMFPMVNAQNMHAKINFSIISPKVNSSHYNELKIVISNPISTYQINHITARVEGIETELTYDEHAYDNKHSGWVGTLSLNDITRGLKTLEITAEDVYGNKFSRETSFYYSKQPSLKINSPSNFDVVNGRLKIDVEAIEEESATIKVYISDEQYFDNRRRISEGINRIDTEVDIDPELFDKKTLFLLFEVTNETGGKYEESRTIYTVEGSLNKEWQVDGEILDFKDNKILYKTTRNQVIMRDLENSEEQLIFDDEANVATQAYITLFGAVIVSKSNDYSNRNYRIYEYKDNNTTYLGRTDLDSSLKVEGDFAIWKGDIKPIEAEKEPIGNKLYIKDLESEHLSLITERVQYNEFDLTENGEVVYTSSEDNQIYKYYNGNLSKVSTGGYVYSNPKISGSAIIYTSYRKNDNTYSLILQADEEETVLSTSTQRFDNYLINGEYVAFSRPINGTRQVFLWKAGTTQQLTYSGLGASVDFLRINGDVIASSYIDGWGHYLFNHNSDSSIRVYGISSNIFWLNEELYSVLGGVVLKIATIPTPIPVRGVTLSEEWLDLELGDEVQLTASVIPSDATDQKVVWLSSNPDVVTVDEKGKIKTKRVGSSTIIVTTVDGNKTADCLVTVTSFSPLFPKINDVTEEDTIVTGKSVPGAQITLKLEENILGTATVEDDGMYSIQIEKQPAGTILILTATDGNRTEIIEVRVKKMQEVPSKPMINEVTHEDTVLTGTTGAGMTVTVKAGETVLATATAGADGQFSVEIPKQPAGTKLTVTVTDEEGRTSEAVEVIVKSTEQPPGGEQPIDECFIATAAYGTKFTPSVTLLRNFRDQFLLTNGLGKKFVEFYYKHSPPIAQFIADSEILKFTVRTLLLPAIAVAYLFFHPYLFILLLGLAGMMVWQWQRKRKLVFM
ncbi:Ig-like domain-containing protein [Caldalkalibacillus mannanilyticus]|uniref:Ig-like domain-containing protein n=1 Tax=Caldalkalibacillus mannanilyticus TaxID=1418 RepID=UPI000469C4C2|nr:Ig-like domain-containing protein [Caldalkalibacillus mannanilyticus]